MVLQQQCWLAIFIDAVCFSCMCLCPRASPCQCWLLQLQQPWSPVLACFVHYYALLTGFVVGLHATCSAGCSQWIVCALVVSAERCAVLGSLPNCT
jgi:hypothetical protein